MSIDKINDLALHNAAIAGDLHAATRRVVDSGWYALGPEVAAFETAFARYCGAAHAVGVGNGTDAIELALRAVGVGVGDEVITAANAGFYASTAIRAIGAVPVYADVEDGNFLLCARDAAARITQKTRAIIITHLFGQFADMQPFVALAGHHGIALVEDCAQAHGAMRSGQRAGSVGDAAAFSFFPTKNLGALGDGGAVVTQRDDVASRVRSLRQYGWSTKYTVVDDGACNSRLDEIQAALLSAKLPYLDEWNARRRAVAVRYAEKMTHPAIQKPLIVDSSHVAHLYVVRCAARDALKQYLQAHGIGCDIHYPLLDTRQPVNKNTPAPRLPVSEKLALEILTLPCYPELTMAEVDQIAECINRWSV
jgi:dTDP-4-amino-4,6-dideoxygalactose transaminase